MQENYKKIQQMSKMTPAELNELYKPVPVEKVVIQENIFPCNLIREKINKDKELISIVSADITILVISSIKLKSAYIPQSANSCFLKKTDTGYNLIYYDKMGYRSEHFDIDRFMKIPKLLSKIEKLKIELSKNH